IAEITKLAKTAPQATRWTLARPSRLPRSPFTAAPKSGNRTIQRSASCSPSAGFMADSHSMKLSPSVLQRVDPADLQRASVADQRDHDRESHGRLRRRHGDDEEGRGLAGHGLMRPAEGQKGHVRGVEHELHAHENHQGVAPNQQRRKAHGEERGTERQVVCERDAAHGQILGLATTIAPTIATSRRMEVDSNGTMNGPKIRRPTEATWPKPSGSSVGMV